MDAAEKLDESCRLCDENCDKMYSIFDKNEEGLEMLRLIKECLPIIIYRTDPLSKIICESCFNNVNALYTFKKIAEETADRQKEKLRASIKVVLKKTKINSEDSPPIDSENQAADAENDAMETESRTDPESRTPDMPDEECIRMFLACDDEPEEGSELKDKGTSTDGLSIYCNRCKQPIPDPSTVNGELEICTDLHKAIVESMAKNKVATASEKSLRKRKVVPFYHELEDSLCSSLTELTQNTEGSQCFDMNSDFEDSMDSVEIQPRLKRRRIIESEDENEHDNENDNEHDNEHDNDESATNSSNKVPVRIKKPLEINGNMESLFMEEEEYRFQPLSLLKIVLNFINKQNISDYDPAECASEVIYPVCNHCGTQFQNYKLLAIHEVQHMDVEIDEKIDNPIPWSEDREDASVRNKWLTYFDENGYGDDDIIIQDSVNADSLLIPMEEKGDVAERVLTGEEKIVLDGTQPMVNGVYLGDYTKEERKTFYQTMRIQGVNKKYCELCRYTFKDNWAIEGHYFSSACYYTCRYCGMRFNKQRHKFKEHVEEHKEKKDPISDKVYAASKMSNIVPKVLHPPKPRKVVPPQYTNNNNSQQFREQNNHSIRVRNFEERRAFGQNIQIKEEPGETKGGGAPSKTAFFCRKCYKVFFKLEEFNVHSKHCDYNQLPQMRPVNNKPPVLHPVRNGEMPSTGRPVRNCAKEIGPYKDEAFLPESILKEPRGREANSNQTFICYICNTPFPTIYSRNSHMRIHKAEGLSMSPMPPFYRTPQPRPQNPPHHPQNNHFQNYRNPPMRQQQNYHMSQHMLNVDIKQEPMDMPMEPMVEIHEQEPTYPDSIGDGAVSITPINKKPNPKPTLNPSIMRMVQNNPSISIKPRSPEKPQQQNMANISSNNQIHMNNINMSMAMGVPLPDDNRSYKCSSCWEAFANKSHLYFHKKNQCEGSRLPCPFCKKRFGTEAEYSSHIYYSHPE